MAQEIRGITYALKSLSINLPGPGVKQGGGSEGVCGGVLVRN